MSIVPLSLLVRETVGFIFAQEAAEAARLLEERCGAGVAEWPGREPEDFDRLRLAAVKISDGKIESLTQAIDLANEDWRELVARAEFHQLVGLHQRWAEAIKAIREGIFVPEPLAAQREAVIARIYEAFKGVSREGGVSWSEAQEIDGYGSGPTLEEARARDVERSWEELVDDRRWPLEVDGFDFLDAIGFRYYIAPAMIRTMRMGEGFRVEGVLSAEPVQTFKLSKYTLLNKAQNECVVQFLRYMIAYDTWAAGDPWVKTGAGVEWRVALKEYWAQFQ